MNSLTLDNLAAGLETFGGDRYQALDVFFEDLRLLPEGDRARLLVDGSSGFAFSSRDRWYRLELLDNNRVARVTRKASPPGTGALAGGGLGALAGIALSPDGKSTEGAAVGLLLGMLVGAALEQDGPRESSAPRRVFALRFDPNTGTWRAYAGGLVGWMKAQLAPGNAVAGLG